MRYNEIRHRKSATHPYVATVSIDPADHHQLVRHVDQREELCVVSTDTSTPDQWTVRVGCASRRVQDQFENLMDARS
jgi:hypothetical protein